MKIGICADHGGYALKKSLVNWLEKQEYYLVDFGAYVLNEDDDYPDFVIPLARAMASGEIDRGIAVCGSGVGVSIAANKIKGARAALIQDDFSAHQGVEDDDMNIICLGGRVTGEASALEYVRTFLNAEFTAAARHLRRINKVKSLEE
ncbi:MAG: RpiB/LacA/LacB family sugar-phosphate isomerase [Ferruginibacter sp.]